MIGMLLWFNLAFGLQNGDISNDVFYQKLPSTFLTIDVHAENEWLDIFGKYYNGMHPEFPYLSPTQDIFEIGATLKYKAVALTIEHGCFHPVSVSPIIDLEGFWGGYNRISIGVCSK